MESANLTYKVGKAVSGLAAHKSACVAEACDVVDVALEPRRVGLQHDKDERR